MDHPDTRLLARYALGEITDDVELAAFEDHLLACEDCRRRAIAVDLIGTSEGNAPLSLHIAADSGGLSALCGDTQSRNIISENLLGGLEASLVCPKCLALAKAGRRPN
ncbi:MAG TPA: zf-HC2 domain-containing protein [Bryobacteraceae bacterium]|jgi:hypothetical protein|nr:zf-HC2 domain-containing protein [Bryobacteraceae bacterium]